MRSWKEWRRRRCWEWPLCQRTDCFLEHSGCLILDPPRLSICFLNGKENQLILDVSFSSHSHPFHQQFLPALLSKYVLNLHTSYHFYWYPIAQTPVQISRFIWLPRAWTELARQSPGPLYLLVPRLEQFPFRYSQDSFAVSFRFRLEWYLLRETYLTTLSRITFSYILVWL